MSTVTTSKTPTSNHGKSKLPSEKPSNKTGAQAKRASELRSKARNDRDARKNSKTLLQEVQHTQLSRSSEVPLLICGGALKPPKAKKRKLVDVPGRGKVVVATESESKEDQSDDEEYVEVALPEGDGEPRESVDDLVWNKNFVSKKAWLHWQSLKGKQVNPTLFERPLNFEAVRKDFLLLVQKIERKGWTHCGW
ncbi:hypothetical protein A4A49_20547 [Nicotiana attenuata]|uniref:Uncharacterized protein n=1 Tax=Nicotiana attenuata TaxID=49451 RepID=A0A1J6J044_NICAT|nr:hypothetical protein A4A49_20547 [Nicotiana attenuata]